MGINIRQTPGFDRSTSGIYEKMNATEAESAKKVQDALKVEEGQVVEGTVCENKGQKSIQIQGEELPVSSEVMKDYNVGETVYLKVDTKEEGKVSLKILSSDEVEQIKAEQIKTEQKTDTRKSLSRTNSMIGKGQQEMQAVSKKIETATGEIAKLLKSSKVTVTVSKDVEKAVEKVVKELDVAHVNLLEHQDVEVENTDVRTLSNMISNLEQQEQKEANKEEIMKAVVEKGKELSTFPDGKMYYMISNELELTVNNLYKAEYSYDKDYQSQDLSKEEWEQLKPKVEEYLKKEQIAPNEENMRAAKWLMDQKLPISKANVADVKAMQTISKEGVEEEVLQNNVKHYFELNLDPKEANVFYENEGKVAEKLMEKVSQLEEKDMDFVIEQLVKEEKPLTLDNILKEAYKQETEQASKEVVSKEQVQTEETKSSNEKVKDAYEIPEKTVSKQETRGEQKSDGEKTEVIESKSSDRVNLENIKEETALDREKPEIVKEEKGSDKQKPEVTKEERSLDKEKLEIAKEERSLGKERTEIAKEEKVLDREKPEVAKEERILDREKPEVAKNETGYSVTRPQVSKEEKALERTKTEISNEKKKWMEAKEEVLENASRKEVTEEEQNTADFEKVLDELDEKDVNYRKIENQEKRNQEEKEKKEEIPSAKEEVSYEQLGKTHIKRQPKRFQMKEIAVAEESKNESLENVKEDKGTKIENPRLEWKEREVPEEDSQKSVKKESVDLKRTTETTVKEDKTLGENTEREVKEENNAPSTDAKKEVNGENNPPSADVKKEEKEENNTSSIDTKKEVKKEDNTLKADFEKEWQEENQALNMLLEEAGRVNADLKESATKETAGKQKESSAKEIAGTQIEKVEGKTSEGLEEKTEGRIEPEKELPLKGEHFEKKETKEQKEFSSKEMERKELKEFSSKEMERKEPARDSLSDVKDSKGENLQKGPVQEDKKVSESVEKERLLREQSKDKDVSEKEISKAQNREEGPSFDGAELEAKVITAKRQLEEIRLKLTLSSAKVLAKNDIKIDTKELSEIVDQLKELEKEACKRQLIENRIEPTEENIEQFRITTKMAEELKEMPSYSIAKFVREPIPMTMESLHEEGRKQKADFDAANERYETMMTKPRSDMGDSISKAFRNVDDILKEMDLEVTEANQRAVRILGYNSMEITKENLEAVKAKDLSVNRLLNQLTPQKVMEFIRKGENIIQVPIEELNLKMETMNNEVQEKEVARYSEFLYKLEKNKEITPEERTAFVGVYRLLDKVVKSKGRDIGALVKSGQEITLKNLLTAQRTIKASKIDANIDDDFGMVSEVIEKGVKITDQIEQGFSNAEKQLQQVEKEPQTKQDSLMQQKISYQQDLAKEILEYINPSDLKSLSKVFGENLENMTFEQIKDRLSRANGKNFEAAAFTGEVVLDEYQEEQMKEWKQLAQTEQRVIKALSDYDVSKTLSNAKAFETIFSKETPLFEQIKKEFEPKTKKEEKEKKIQKSISSLGGFFDGKEEAVSAYEDFADDLMEQSGQEETLTTKEILARKNLMLAGNLMAKMAREESFIVPVQIQNKDTTMEVTLKSKGNEKGTIQASIIAGDWGEISAELLVEEKTVSIYSKAESKEGETALNKALGVFEGALSSKNIILQQSAKPINGTGQAATKQLYQVAKSFVEAFRA